LGEIKALFEWVQHHVRYTKDPFRVEVLMWFVLNYHP
jgi:hypothetical protein